MLLSQSSFAKHLSHWISRVVYRLYMGSSHRIQQNGSIIRRPMEALVSQEHFHRINISSTRIGQWMTNLSYQTLCERTVTIEGVFFSTDQSDHDLTLTNWY